MPFASIWIDPEGVLLSEVSQTEKEKCDIKGKVAQLCPTLCNPMDCRVHGILQAKILEWVAIPFPRGSS